MKVHLVTAEHFSTPGLIQKAFANKLDAIGECVRITQAMLSDSELGRADQPEHYMETMERLQDYYGAAHCYVEITELEVAGSAFIDAALEIASQVAKAGTDDEGDMIVYADDVSGDVDILRDAQAIEGDIDAYLARFPADHRATADRAYQDGYVDGVESARAEG